MKTKERRTLEDVLHSVSSVMFPAELGEKQVFIDSRDVEGDTPLHVMVLREDLYGAKILIEAGADVNAVGDMGETPLHVALTNENEELTELLLNSEADPDIRSEFEETARAKAEMLGGAFKRQMTKCRPSPRSKSPKKSSSLPQGRKVSS